MNASKTQINEALEAALEAEEIKEAIKAGETVATVATAPQAVTNTADIEALYEDCRAIGFKRKKYGTVGSRIGNSVVWSSAIQIANTLGFNVRLASKETITDEIAEKIVENEAKIHRLTDWMSWGLYNTHSELDEEVIMEIVTTPQESTPSAVDDYAATFGLSYKRAKQEMENDASLSIEVVVANKEDILRGLKLQIKIAESAAEKGRVNYALTEETGVKLLITVQRSVEKTIEMKKNEFRWNAHLRDEIKADMFELNRLVDKIDNAIDLMEQEKHRSNNVMLDHEGERLMG